MTANLFSDGVPQARVASNRPQPVLDGAGDGSYSNNCVRVWDTDAGRVHGFSNSHCDDPSWPKVSFLRDRVTEILAALPVRKGMHHPDCGRFCCSPANMCGLLPAPLSDAQVLALAEKLAVPMGRTEPFPDDAVPDVGFSPLLPAQERCVGCLGVESATPPQLMSVLRGAWLGMCRELQKRAFIPASVTHRSYGTRAQTIVIADTGWCAGQCVHHCQVHRTVLTAGVACAVEQLPSTCCIATWKATRMWANGCTFECRDPPSLNSPTGGGVSLAQGIVATVSTTAPLQLPRGPHRACLGFHGDTC